MIKFKREFPVYIKFILLAIALIIAAATLIYTNNVVKTTSRERKKNCNTFC